MITVKDVKYFFDTENVSQVRSMQLFIVNYNLLVSYSIIVGVLGIDDRWYLTKDRYSATTARQVNRFRKVNEHVFVDHEDMEYWQDFYYPNGIHLVKQEEVEYWQDFYPNRINNYDNRVFRNRIGYD